MTRKLFTLLAVSAVLCAGVFVLWARSDRPGRDPISFRWRGQRYTLRSRAGALTLTGPPEDAGFESGEWAQKLFSRPVIWGVRLPDPRDPILQQREVDSVYEYVDGRHPRVLLAGLEDPQTFTSAHAMLTPWNALQEAAQDPTIHDPQSAPVPPWPAGWEGPRDGGGDDTIWYYGLRLHITGPHPTSPWRMVAIPDPDPAQLPAIRDYWHRRLDVPVWSIPYWQLALALALPAPLWLTLRALRAAVARHLRPRLRPAGLCPACGYDLRATPGRCPECGATPAARRGSA